MLKQLSSIALVCFATTAMADVTLVMQDSGGANGEFKSTSTVRVKDGTVVMTENDNGGTIMFRQADSAIVQIDHDSRSYVVIDQEMAKQMTAAFSQQMAMMKEKLANLPPEQREQLMARIPQLSGMPELGGKTKTSVERTGKTDSINGFSCETVNVSRGGQATGAACVASAKALGISKSDFATIKGMMMAMGDFAEQMGTNEMPDFEAIGGFPVKYNNSADDDGSSVLQSVSTDDLGDEHFVIPEGYTKRSIGQ